MVTKEEGVRRGKDWKFGIRRCKLLYIGRINNKVQLHSTGGCIQHPVIKHKWSRKLHRLKRLVGHSPWGHPESDTTEHECTQTIMEKNIQ